MREIISFSLGKHSNYIATHFWNSQDESLKVEPQNPNEEQSQEIKPGTQMVYHETENSKQLMPRHVFIDYNDNFGNYSACFQGNDKYDKQQVKNEFGQQFNVEETAQEQIPLSSFQQELMNIDDIYTWNQNYEEQQIQEEKEEEKEEVDIMDTFKGQGQGGNTRDMFAQMFMQEQTKYAKRDETEIEKAKYEKNNEKLEELQGKTPDQLYDDYKFDSEVRFFADFMQSQMSIKFNQLVVPNQHIFEQDFGFFNKGRELWSVEGQFKEDIEDKIRHQLEIADLLQGFQLTVDTNSGYGSLGNQIITYFLKDEAPKAPVYLYSINNYNKVHVEEGADDEDKTNAITRQELIDINQSLFFSESEENIDFLIPFDEIKIGKGLKEHFGAYKKDLVFHQSAIQSLVKQNIYSLIQDQKSGLDMHSFKQKVLYAGSPLNITLPQLQIPIQRRVDQDFLQTVKKEHLNGKDYFVNFNKLTSLEKKRHPVKHTYVVRGLNSLVGKNVNPRSFKEQFESFIFTNQPYERGFNVLTMPDVHYLPIPYPRYLTPNRISTDGLIKAVGDEKPDFVQQMPLIMKLLFDGSYLGHCESMYKKLKYISPKTRQALLRENDNMEEDEWREKVENLDKLCENYRNMALNTEPGSESSDDMDY